MAATADEASQQPSFRDRCQIGQANFCLCLRKCCNYDSLFLFPKSFLRFKHIRDMMESDYPDADLEGIYLDAECQLEVPTDWNEQLVYKSLAAANVRPCSKPDDIIAYRFFLKMNYHTEDRSEISNKCEKCRLAASDTQNPPAR